MLFADLHLHSKYSRAVSARMDLENLEQGALKKGLGLLGTGDFTHPLWFAELRRKMEETGEGTGVFKLKHSSSIVRFVLQTEISTIFSDGAKVRKVHHVVFAPSFEVVSQLNDALARKGSLEADGRPTFGNTPCAEFVELCRQVSQKIEVIPAHAWTPWFSVFGSNSGYDSIEEAYGDQSRFIRAYETGMSSNPVMNWRLSALDRFAQVSNSDSHSPYPYRIGREANAFNIELEKLTYSLLFDAIYSRDVGKFLFTVEVDPNYGKYHFDGHRNCKFSCSPAEAIRLNNRCPVCRRQLTIGVLHRVEQLADRPLGFRPDGAIPFKTLLPLQELVAACFGSPLASRKVFEETERLTAKFGNEFSVLLETTKEALQKETSPRLAEVILLNREGKLRVRPGFDGEYGVLELEPVAATELGNKQKGLLDF